MSTMQLRMLARLARGLAGPPDRAVRLLDRARDLVFEVGADRGLARAVHERARQQAVERFSAEADLRHPRGRLRLAAVRYLVHGLGLPDLEALVATYAPAGEEWFKPRSDSENLVRGVALGLAAISRSFTLEVPAGGDLESHAADLADQLPLRGLCALGSWEVGRGWPLLVVEGQGLVEPQIVDRQGAPTRGSCDHPNFPLPLPVELYPEVVVEARPVRGGDRIRHRFEGVVAHEVQRAMFLKPRAG
jgi:hypothetical protein